MNIQNQLFKPDGKNSIHDGIEHSPSGGKALIDPTDTVLLLLDNQPGLFVKTVRETGKKTLIIAGVWTNVCVMFPALDAKAEGYNVYVVIDASGDPSEIASRTTLARFTQAGVVPTSANAVTCELHRTWNRPDAAQLAELYCMASPSYQAVMESFNKAQEVEAAKQTNNGPKSTRSTTPALAAQSR